MQSPRAFTEDEVREIVEAIAQPTVVTRDERVVIVNRAWLKERGVRREDVEGKASSDLLADEIPTRAYTSQFPPDFRVTFVLRDGFDLTLDREVLALSSELMGATSAHDVRERTRAALSRGGMTALFWRTNEPPLCEVDAKIAARAIASATPTFVGPDVYIPLDGGNEVLFVAGSSLTDVHAFRHVGKLISTALLDVHASDAAQRKLSDTQLLLQLARTTSGTLDLGTVMNLTADSLVQLLDLASCIIMLHDEKANALRGGASSHIRRDRVKSLTIPLDDPCSIAARAARERRVIAIEDTSMDPLAMAAPLVAVFEETALCALPILTRGRLEGVVILDETRGPRTFTPEWLELATAMVAQVGLSIANARLYDSLRQSYEEVAQTRAEMVKRERLAGLGELAATVAHEVRNPLGVIFNATTSLSRIVNGSSPEGATLLGIVREECERLNQIVGDLLDFARPKQLTLQRDDIGRVISEVADAVNPAPSVRVEVLVHDDLPLISVDRRLMRQALLNVTINAVQAMPQGGVLQFRAQLCPEGTDMLVAVGDNGPGIAEEDMPRIFEPFFTTKATGAGLGLALVKRIVEDHGGQVTVRSSKMGTTFCFRLPLPRAS